MKKKTNNKTTAATVRGRRFRGNELKYLKQVLDSDLKTNSRRGMIGDLERKFAKRVGVQYAISSNSGTSTLHQALMAFGVGPGDEVIVPALTAVMCGYAVIQAGARPGFADVNADTFLIDPKDVERKITPKTKAIMPVHLYGQVCDMAAIVKIAKKH